MTFACSNSRWGGGWAALRSLRSPSLAAAAASYSFRFDAAKRLTERRRAACVRTQITQKTTLKHHSIY